MPVFYFVLICIFCNVSESDIYGEVNERLLVFLPIKEKVGEIDLFWRSGLNLKETYGL